MHAADNVIPQEAVLAQAVVQDVLGRAVLGLYLFGSAVTGGLRQDSDVDLLVAVRERPTDQERAELVRRLMAVSGKIGNASSRRPIELTVVNLPDVVPWRYPPRAEFVYGEWLREEFEAGKVPEPAHDPDLTIVLKQAVDHSVPLLGPPASGLFDQVPQSDVHRAIIDSLPALLAGLQGDERNVILTLARMWLTAATGEIKPKDIAAGWAAGHLPPGQALLLHEARAAYVGEARDSWGHKQEQLNILVRHLERSIKRCLSV